MNENHFGGPYLECLKTVPVSESCLGPKSRHFHLWTLEGCARRASCVRIRRPGSPDWT